MFVGGDIGGRGEEKNFYGWIWYTYYRKDTNLQEESPGWAVL